MKTWPDLMGESATLLDLLVPFLLTRNCRYWFRSPISPYSMTVQGGCSAVHTPMTLHMLASDSPARKRTSRSDSMEPTPELCTSLGPARSGQQVRTATRLQTPGIMSQRPSVSNKVI